MKRDCRFQRARWRELVAFSAVIACSTPEVAARKWQEEGSACAYLQRYWLEVNVWKRWKTYQRPGLFTRTDNIVYAEGSARVCWWLFAKLSLLDFVVFPRRILCNSVSLRVFKAPKFFSSFTLSVQSQLNVRRFKYVNPGRVSWLKRTNHWLF